MRYCFWMQMDDLGRTEARVIEIFDRVRVTIVTLSLVRLDRQIHLSGVIEAGEGQAHRIEALLSKIEGMSSMRVAVEMDLREMEWAKQ